MKKLNILLSVFYLLILASCSSSKVSKKTGEQPEWINDPESLCKKSQLCAVGYGEDLNVAQTNAKKVLASYFGTKIEGTFSHSYSQAQSNSNFEEEEQLTSEVEETVSQILKGVKFTHQYVKDKAEEVYALAMLNKHQAAKSINMEMLPVDSELLRLYEARQRVTIRRMHYLLKKRMILNEKYLFLTGHALPCKVTEKKIEDLKTELRNQSQIYIDRGNLTEDILTELESLFFDLGYKVVFTKGFPSLSARMELKEEYFKVEGFKKYSINLILQSFGKSGKRLGQLNFLISSTGRSKDDAITRSKTAIKIKIKESIHKLNLE